MKRAWIAALLLLAACGLAEEEEPCTFAEQAFRVDGEEVFRLCTSTQLQADVYEDRVSVAITPGVFGGQPEFFLKFEGDALPAEFPLLLEEPRRPEVPWAAGTFRYYDETGPLRATSGTARLQVRDDRVIVEIEGTLARRDGVERPFTARLEAMLEVNCWFVEGGPTPASSAQQQRCDELRALSTWRHPAHP